MKSGSKIYYAETSRKARIIRMYDESMGRRVIENAEQSRIAIPTNQGTLFVGINEISHCCAESNYTRMIYGKGQEVLISKSLGTIASVLPHEMFLRVHQSHLVNTEQVQSIHGDHLMLLSGRKIPISRSRRSFLKKEMDKKTITIQ